jgi:hypothetical protein
VTFAEFRAVLIAQLSEDFEFRFQAGEIVQPSTDFDLGCIFKTRDQPMGTSYELREDHFTVRIILRDLSLQQPAPEVALDPTPLEEAAEQILASLTGLQQFEDGYCVWIRTDYRNINRIVDVMFRSFTRNTFNTGG